MLQISYFDVAMERSMVKFPSDVQALASPKSGNACNFEEEFNSAAAKANTQR
jgi:hypothetical protein